ncbi:nucleotidyltransferase domain-containing protein [bacterium]|nr:nucleotidyltransferase domain-containing protein [bacterium]
MTFQELKTYKNQILTIGRQFGITRIKVFGSTVRDSADTMSDVDLLVDMEPGRSLFDLGGFQLAVRDLIRQEVDIVTVNGLRDRIRQTVLKEAVEL